MSNSQGLTQRDLGVTNLAVTGTTVISKLVTRRLVVSDALTVDDAVTYGTSSPLTITADIATGTTLVYNNSVVYLEHNIVVMDLKLHIVPGAFIDIASMDIAYLPTDFPFILILATFEPDDGSPAVLTPVQIYDNTVNAQFITFVYTPGPVTVAGNLYIFQSYVI